MTDHPPLREQPFRYGIFDLLVVIVLGALESLGFAAMIRQFSVVGETLITVFGLIFGYAFAIGAGFLASRRWTERRVESPWRRVGLILGVNLLLYAIFTGLWIAMYSVAR